MEKTTLVAAKKLNKTELKALAEVIIEDANKIISKKRLDFENKKPASYNKEVKLLKSTHGVDVIEKFEKKFEKDFEKKINVSRPSEYNVGVSILNQKYTPRMLNKWSDLDRIVRDLIIAQINSKDLRKEIKDIVKNYIG